jgi:hypothetical protein
MTPIIEARVISPYLTVHDVLRAGIRRSAERKDMAAARSKWDSEGGAIEAGEWRRGGLRGLGC